MTKKKTVLIVGLVVLVGLAWFTVRQIQVHNQRKNFYDTQAWLQKVMDEVAKENPGGTRIGESVCLRTSVKYQQGERYCVVGEDILYATSIVEANLAAPKVLTSVKKETEVSIKQLSTKYNTNIVAAFGFSRNGLDCAVEEYVLDHQSSYAYSSPAIKNFKDGLRVSLSCSGPAMADYFPSRS